MGSNTDLTREDAVKLIKGQEVVCPHCGQDILTSRYTYKHKNVEFKCLSCKEIYHPCKLI
jgi:transposase-like protein